jgi:hypothetical protein
MKVLLGLIAAMFLAIAFSDAPEATGGNGAASAGNAGGVWDERPDVWVQY